jgi:hypothetical protein
MTATVEIKDSLVKKAKKFTGMADNSKMLNEVLKTYINAEEFARNMLPLQDSDVWEGEPKKGVK